MKKIKLVTHDNRFHSDDVFATATLLLMLKDKEFEIIRTRDNKVIESADFVYDVGGIYDEENNRFDHHQEGKVGERENGIPYSSFGLIWKKFGTEVCGLKDIADMLDKKIVQPIDILDNGMSLSKPIHEGIRPYIINDIVSAFDPSWPEDQDFDGLFLRAVEMAKWILEREIIRAQDVEKARGSLEEIYNKTEDKRIIILEENYPWENILNKYPEPLFVVKTRGEGGWSIKAVRDDMYSFEYRSYFPESWAGKRGEELSEITGVEGSIFCHNARFICAAKSKEGAIKLAKIALNN
ncbi:MYG1 family protein [Patescibacteria group bacterium]|nr:MYG1 family protein [Patescibacteria group bacterium]